MILSISGGSDTLLARLLGGHLIMVVIVGWLEIMLLCVDMIFFFKYLKDLI